MKTTLAVLILGAMSANAGDFSDRKAIEDASARIAAAIQFEGQRRDYEAETIQRRLEYQQERLLRALEARQERMIQAIEDED